MKRFLLFTFFLAISQLAQSQQKSFEINALTCELRINPVGISQHAPRVSWQVQTKQQGWKQTAYQVSVSDDSISLSRGIANKWQSNRIVSGESLQIEYNGPPLKPHTTYWWKVKVWDNKGNVAESAINRWAMGIINRGDWEAQWIESDMALYDYQKQLRGMTDYGMEPETEIWQLADSIRKMTKNINEAPAVYMRKEFTSTKKVRHAYATVCGLGLHELYVNGNKIGHSFLNPAPTDYDKTIFYHTYDVTENLLKGNNAVGVILGNGWYNLVIPHLLRYYAADYISTPKLRLELHIVYNDGSTKKIMTDKTWKFTTDGPITFNNILSGETINHNKNINGWDDVGYNDKNWKSALLAKEIPKGLFRAQNLYPVEIIGQTKPKQIEYKNDTTIIDFGKELTGWCRASLRGHKGQVVKVEYPGASSHTLGRYQTDMYVLKGDGIETFEPRFSYNGFQKIIITGLNYKPLASDFTAMSVNTAFPTVGYFKCSNDTLNRLQDAIIQTIKNYVVHIPNDPTREKAGWVQDVEGIFDVYAYNYDSHSMFEKWQLDFMDSQHENGYMPPVSPGRFDGPTINGPWWGGMIVYQPWKVYQHYGDKKILMKSYDAMKKQVSYLKSISKDLIVEWGLGDWLEAGRGVVRPVRTPVPLTSTLAFYNYASIVSKTAALLGQKDEEKAYRELADAIQASYHNKFYNPQTGQYATGSQACQIMSLCLGIVPELEKQKVIAALLKQIHDDNDHLSTGFVSTPFLLTGLSDLGYPELAYKIATQTDYPSWYGMVFGGGNTTLKETWEGGLVQMPSLGGPIGAWFYYSLAGIKPASPGFKEINIEPDLNTPLKWVDASYKTPYGKISVSWKKDADKILLNVVIPANTTASVKLPLIKKGKIYQNGRLINHKTLVNHKTALPVGSGSYKFILNNHEL